MDAQNAKDQRCIFWASLQWDRANTSRIYTEHRGVALHAAVRDDKVMDWKTTFLYKNKQTEETWPRHLRTIRTVAEHSSLALNEKMLKPSLAKSGFPTGRGTSKKNWLTNTHPQTHINGQIRVFKLTLHVFFGLWLQTRHKENKQNPHKKYQKSGCNLLVGLSNTPLAFGNEGELTASAETVCWRCDNPMRSEGTENSCCRKLYFPVWELHPITAKASFGLGVFSS